MQKKSALSSQLEKEDATEMNSINVFDKSRVLRCVLSSRKAEATDTHRLSCGAACAGVALLPGTMGVKPAVMRMHYG